MFVIFIILLFIIFSIFKLYSYLRVKYAKIEVETIDNLDIEVYSKVKISKLIKSINDKIINDKYIDTNDIGKKDISFKFINNDNIKVSYSFKVNIVDTTAPIISNRDYITVYQDSVDNISKSLFCGDNYDDNPTCNIEGEYDLNTIGEYPVSFIGADNSGNTSKKDLTIIVKNKENTTTTNNIEEFSFDELKTLYKTDSNKIGIDVSKWQGDIDYQKVKDAGVEFVIIRIGYQKGIDGKYFLDPKFEDNIKGFNKVGIKVGLYFFSYANSNSDAIKQAKWITNKIKKYKISLPIVFDWENFGMYQDFNLSFKHLNDMANAFMKQIEKDGYTPMLYSSKNYLLNIWYETKYPIWLAHYTDKTDYTGNYSIWQMTDTGTIDGIDNYVDIDIMY